MSGSLASCALTHTCICHLQAFLVTLAVIFTMLWFEQFHTFSASGKCSEESRIILTYFIWNLSSKCHPCACKWKKKKKIKRWIVIFLAKALRSHLMTLWLLLGEQKAGDQRKPAHLCFHCQNHSPQGSTNYAIKQPILFWPLRFSCVVRLNMYKFRVAKCEIMLLQIMASCAAFNSKLFSK